MQHKNDGYEFSAIGGSRIFRKGDVAEDALDGHEIVHRRYLKDSKTWFDKDYEPTIKQQSQEHESIFAYNVSKSCYDLIGPENAVIEDSDETGELDIPPIPEPINLQEEVENVIEEIDNMFVDDSDITIPDEQPQTKTRSRK
ncbi:MAG: hypothetical protein ACRDBG_07690 [Waterburya sp.]